MISIKKYSNLNHQNHYQNPRDSQDDTNGFIKINKIEQNNFQEYFPLFDCFNSYDFISFMPNKNMYHV